MAAYQISLIFYIYCLTICNGKALIDGDILPHKHQNRIRRGLSTNPSDDYLWQNGIVPYQISKGLGPRFEKNIIKGMKKVEKNTCIKFKRRQGEDDYIEFIASDGCFSHVGRQGGRQIISIGFGCESKQIIIHEILHTLGLYHENTRLDSSLYINVLWWNIQRGAEKNFESRYQDDGINTLSYPYDFHSTTHYKRDEFTKNGENTIEAIEDPNKILGNHIGLSKGDITKINDAYQCHNKKIGECRDNYDKCHTHLHYCRYKWFASKYCKNSCHLCSG